MSISKMKLLSKLVDIPVDADKFSVKFDGRKDELRNANVIVNNKNRENLETMASRKNTPAPEEAHRIPPLRTSAQPRESLSRSVEECEKRNAEEPLRWLEGKLNRSLARAEERSTRELILIEGPRNCGKSSLVTKYRNILNAPIVDMRYKKARSEAESGPLMFLWRYAAVDKLIILHAELSPNLIGILTTYAGTEPNSTLSNLKAPRVIIATTNVSLKETLDKPGITRLRMRTLAKGELCRRAPTFLERFAKKDFREAISVDDLKTSHVLENAMRGGYPDGRSGSPEERHNFFHMLVTMTSSYDLPLVSTIRNPMVARKVYRMAGAYNGSQLNSTEISRILEMRRQMVTSALDALQKLFMVDALETWSVARESPRATKSPAFYVNDSGWLCGLLGCYTIAPKDILQQHDEYAQRLFAGWVYTQLAAMADASDDWKLWQLSLRGGFNIPFILENKKTNEVIAIQAIMRGEVDPTDFKPFVEFARFVAKEADSQPTVHYALIYSGPNVMNPKPNCWVLPAAYLWL